MPITQEMIKACIQQNEVARDEQPNGGKQQWISRTIEQSIYPK